MNQFMLAGADLVERQVRLAGPFKKLAQRIRARVQARRAAGAASPLDIVQRAIEERAAAGQAAATAAPAKEMPSWVVPAALGGVGLVAVMVLTKKRGRK